MKFELLIAKGEPSAAGEIAWKRGEGEVFGPNQKGEMGIMFTITEDGDTSKATTGGIVVPASEVGRLVKALKKGIA